ncbi:MAG: TIGR00289 family protein [Euryarchaeota archaeon]|nr:TIGR00289 family protein [Euryarchaeota archaeon]
MLDPYNSYEFYPQTLEVRVSALFMRVAVLSSGGKDSSAAWWWAKCKGWDIECLVTVIITGRDSWMFQIPGTEIVEKQAELAGLKWLKIDSEGIQEEEILDLEHKLRDLEIDGLVSGAIRSDYQKSRIERMCERLGIKSWTPLWHQSSLGHMRGLVSNGFEVMITSVACEGLTEKWVGHILTEESLKEMEELSNKFRFNVDGEGGEYETLVVSGPHFHGSLEVSGVSTWDGKRGELKIDSVKLVKI